MKDADRPSLEVFMFTVGPVDCDQTGTRSDRPRRVSIASVIQRQLYCFAGSSDG